MKKKLLASILLLVVILPILAADDFLKSFFDGQNFQTKEYTIKDEKIFYSCTFTKKSREIINKGILYKKNGIEVEPLLILDGNIVSNSEEPIFTSIISTQIFYGWKIYVHARKKNFSIKADPYTNNGKNVTDGPTFFWDYNRNIFEMIEQDRSQW